MVERLKLGAFKFDALFLPDNLRQFDQQFLDYLKRNNPQLEQQLLAYRGHTLNAESKQVSSFLIELAQYVESFLVELFEIEAEIERQRRKRMAEEAEKWNIVEEDAPPEGDPVVDDTYEDIFDDEEEYVEDLDDEEDDEDVLDLD